MRVITVVSAVAAVSLAACGQGGAEGDSPRGSRDSAAIEAAMTEGPAPGLWRVTTRIGEMTFPPVEDCVAESKFEAPDSLTDDSDMNCTDETFRREGDAMVAHVVCTAPDGERTTAEMRVTGDFSRNYTMAMTVRTEPAPDPSMAEMTMVSIGERLGDCPADMAAD